MSAQWRKINLICALDGETVTLRGQVLPPMRADLMALFERDELAKYYTEEDKYYTEEELPPVPAAAPAKESH
jgi:succinate dehydrogenase / fumarate reductase flavoprotein subunit